MAIVTPVRKPTLLDPEFASLRPETFAVADTSIQDRIGEIIRPVKKPHVDPVPEPVSPTVDQETAKVLEKRGHPAPTVGTVTIKEEEPSLFGLRSTELLTVGLTLVGAFILIRFLIGAR